MSKKLMTEELVEEWETLFNRILTSNVDALLREELGAEALNDTFMHLETFRCFLDSLAAVTVLQMARTEGIPELRSQEIASLLGTTQGRVELLAESGGMLSLYTMEQADEE